MSLRLVIITLAAVGIGTLTACGSSESGIETAVSACGASLKSGISVGDEGDSISLDGKGEEDDSGADYADIGCILRELNVSDAVISRVDSTRALDGRQEGSWEGYLATWGYHPDSGLDMVIEVARD